MRFASTWSTVIPPRTICPGAMATPESRLPVCAGWIPMPTDDGLNRPWMTLIFCFSGSSGWSERPRVIAAPLPRDHQWLPLTPLPMNSTANRFGKSRAGSDHAATAGNDSSHGSAIAAPAARRTVRREIRSLISALRLWQELQAHRRRRVGEDARRLQPSAAGVDARHEDRVRILVADGEIRRRWIEAEVPRREAGGPLFLDVGERALVRVDCEQHDAVVAAIRRVQPPAGRVDV